MKKTLLMMSILGLGVLPAACQTTDHAHYNEAKEEGFTDTCPRGAVYRNHCDER